MTISGIRLCWWVSSKGLADGGVGALSRDQKFSKILRLHCLLPSRGSPPPAPRLYSFLTFSPCLFPSGLLP